MVNLSSYYMIGQLSLQINKKPCAEVTTDFSFDYPGVQEVSIIHCIAVGVLALGFLAVLVIVRKKWERTKKFGGQKKVSDLKNKPCIYQSKNWFSSSLGTQLRGYVIVTPCATWLSRACCWVDARAVSTSTARGWRGCACRECTEAPAEDTASCWTALSTLEGMAPLLDFLVKRSSYNSPNGSPWIGTGNCISIFQFLLRTETDNTNQNQKFILWEEPKKDSPRASERLHLLSSSLTWLWCLSQEHYYTLMSIPKQVWVLPSYIHLDAKECEQAAWIL